MEFLLAILPYLLPIIASVLTILLVALAKKGLEKLGVDRTEKLDALIDKYVATGVNTANVAATKYLAANGEKLPSATKMSKAVKVVMDELQAAGVTKIAEEVVRARIESWLLDSGEEPGVPSDPPRDGESV